MELVCVEDFEQLADRKLEKNAKDYYKSGAGDQFSLQLNREAFKRLRVIIKSILLLSLMHFRVQTSSASALPTGCFSVGFEL